MAESARLKLYAEVWLPKGASDGIVIDILAVGGRQQLALLVFDYFLFSTGNLSVTYSFLGGWFGVMLAVAVIVTVSYGCEPCRGRENKLLVRGIFNFFIVIPGSPHRLVSAGSWASC